MSVYYGAHKSNVFSMSQYEQYVCYAYALPWRVKREGLSVFYSLITFAFKFHFIVNYRLISDFSVYSLIDSVWVYSPIAKVPF